MTELVSKTGRWDVDHAAAMPDLSPPHDPALRDAVNPERLPRDLDELAAMARRELELTQYPRKSWVLPKMAPDGSRALDVLVVGAGQAGLATGFALLQQRVDNILLIDENPPGLEGPWATYARMETLRTQKDVGGIEFGVPSLSLRAWYEVQHGQGSWEAMYKVPTDAWRRYLEWYRVVTRVPVRNHCRMTRFGPSAIEGLIEIDVENGDGARSRIWTRTLALATGIEGNGRRHIPAVVAEKAPRKFWAHTQEAIDFAALAGKDIAVLGGGASAFDNAIIAAESGARHVDLYHRSPLVRPANAVAWGEFNGYLAHFADLPLADRWRFTRRMKGFRGGPPLRTIARARAAPNLEIHGGAVWSDIAVEGERLRVVASDGARAFDFLILGTGYETGMHLRPEFAEHLDVIALWEDVFTPPDGERDEGLLRSCYVGPHFELCEKRPGVAPWLSSVFNFSRGANLSMGSMSIGLSGIKFGIPRLAQGITRRLFVSDADAFYEGMGLWQTGDDIYEP